MPINKAKFIVFEGIEGSGKSTQVKLTIEWLKSIGINCISTFEPGETDLGKKIRSILLETSDSVEKIENLTELFLYSADRIQHVESFIKPNLDNGVWVISDRFTASTLAYQGAGRNIDKDVLNQVIEISSMGLKPDLILWLKIDPLVGIARKTQSRKLDRIESETKDFHERVASAYKRLNYLDINSFRIDADKPVRSIQSEIQWAIKRAMFKWEEIQEI